MQVCRLFAGLLLVGVAQAAAALETEWQLRIEPPTAVLTGAESRQQLLVTATGDGREWDATELARFESSHPMVATVTAEGVVLPISDGVARITAMLDGRMAAIEVKVDRARVQPPLHFANDIVPLLTRAGCNSGGCHGKQNGQNGFRLSVFGHDPPTDYLALTHEGRGRRLFPGAPDRSLLLTKALNVVPHGGGQRMRDDSPEYRRLLRWIAGGMPKGDDDAPTVTAIHVVPKQRVMREQARQRLLVTAELSDGTRRDVTHEALFSSNDETLAQVDRTGRISTTMLAGESAIVIRYRHHVAACYVTIPLNQDATLAARLADWDRSHFVDRCVAEKWERLRLLPSAPADDATFHRRVYVDLIGKVPTPAEVTRFLADSRPDKRTRLIDALLERPEYADFWALKWADLLRINREELGPKSAFQYHQWLWQALRKNQPYDQFLRELLTSQGNNERNWAANFYKAFKDPNDLTIAVSQVFLGMRLECARCHHHPYEKWGQEDFFGFAAFFPRVTRKPAGGTALNIYVADSGEVKHPRTQEVMRPRVLLGEPFDPAEVADPRQRLADWIAAPDNPYVARSLVNRVWAHLMGRGLVEPIDDMRDTNPATNEPLLQALAADFVANGYDVRRLIRTIASSQVYALSSEPNASNARDLQNYSRAYRKRLSAEVLLDAISDVTGEAESFAGMPPGTRAVQLWDHRLPSVFLDTFGRPQRKTVCQCERVSDATLGQVLHLLNSPNVNDKITAPTGRVARLTAGELAPDAIIADLYLAAFGRLPREGEYARARAALSDPGTTRRQAAEDILWSLINSAEFLLNH